MVDIAFFILGAKPQGTGKHASSDLLQFPEDKHSNSTAPECFSYLNLCQKLYFLVLTNKFIIYPMSQIVVPMSPKTPLVLFLPTTTLPFLTLGNFEQTTGEQLTSWSLKVPSALHV